MISVCWKNGAGVIKSKESRGGGQVKSVPVFRLLTRLTHILTQNFVYMVARRVRKHCPFGWLFYI